ncbi:hypothetical protein PRUPE_4G122200 [Prunus persica]|uniref:Uncharacterized protein n=1 Tax=Prunus persica TaxID=3760 RepID=A0A251PJF3_PRUPE|nr:hypothetical protein PRUPE_4G122200 [Prunus persica]
MLRSLILCVRFYTKGLDVIRSRTIYYMRLSIFIDLPSNNLEGEVPEEITTLIALSILNLYAYFRFFHDIKDKATLTIDLMSIGWFVKQILTEKRKRKRVVILSCSYNVFI